MESNKRRLGSRRGQVRSWLFTVDSEKNRFRKRAVFIWLSREQPEEKTRLQREIEATDHQIDQLVYEHYVIPS